MAILFPINQPAKFFPWSRRDSGAARTLAQEIHMRDDFMFQFYDRSTSGAPRLNHRVVVLNALFEPIGEIEGTELDKQQIGDDYVYTGQIRGEQYAELGEKIYLGVLDANNNFYTQNYLIGGLFNNASTSFWALEEGSTISGGNLTYNGTFTASSATYLLPLKPGSQYTMIVDVGSSSGSALSTIKCGSTVGPEPLVLGVNTFTFTAASSEFSVEFASSGSGSISIASIDLMMVYEDVTPNWISAPFCVRDIESQMLLNGCAVNDYLNMYFVGTGFIPRIRINAEFVDAAPLQEIERAFLSNGTINNYYASTVTSQQLKIQWMPAYLVNFMSVVFLLDSTVVDGQPYSLVEEIQVQESAEAPKIKGYSITLAPKEQSIGFKRVVNDPSDASCTITSGAYQNQYTGEIYQQQQTDENYYAQN
jgi:hypothetical protein